MSQKIDFGGRRWSAVSHDHHLAWAGHPLFPDYMRVVFVAYGRHAANGHAVLERGELAQFLVRTDGTLPDRRQVWASMKKAIQLGYLLPGSRAECLIVNRDNVQGGIGDPDAKCRRNHKIREREIKTDHDPAGRFRASVGPDDRQSASSVGPDAGHFDRSVGPDDRHSALSPSVFSSPPTDLSPERQAS